MFGDPPGKSLKAACGNCGDVRGCSGFEGAFVQSIWFSCQLLQGDRVLADDATVDADMDLQLVLLSIYGPPTLNVPGLVATDLAIAARQNSVDMIRCLLEAVSWC